MVLKSFCQQKMTTGKRVVVIQAKLFGFAIAKLIVYLRYKMKAYGC